MGQFRSFYSYLGAGLRHQYILRHCSWCCPFGFVLSSPANVAAAVVAVIALWLLSRAGGSRHSSELYSRNQFRGLPVHMEFGCGGGYNAQGNAWQTVANNPNVIS